MSLKLQLKESIFAILDLLPEKQGFYLYHKLQEILNGRNMSRRVKSNEGNFRIFQRLLRDGNVSLQGKRVMEIGSGWVPVLPYFMLFLGKAKEVDTFDIKRHFSKPNILRLNEIFSDEYSIEVDVVSNSEYPLPHQIKYHPDTDIINADLPDADVVFSRFVLEHVRQEDILLMHQKLKKVLKPGTTIVHLISPSDHRAHLDPKLSLQDFLKYSEREWEKKQTRFDYHNRLRLPQYLKIFKEANLEILNFYYDKPKLESNTYKKFKALKLHKDFNDFEDEELMAGSINVVLRV